MLLALLIKPALSSDVQLSQPQHMLSAKELMHYCSGRYDIDYGYCAGYMEAVSDIMLDHSLYNLRACSHGMVKSQQILELFRMHVTKHPEREGFPASAAVAEALSFSFPCHR